MLNVTFQFASTMARELGIISIEAAVILRLRSSEGAYPPDTQSRPINAARKALQRLLRHAADVTLVVIRPFDGLYKVRLRFPCLLGYLR